MAAYSQIDSACNLKPEQLAQGSGPGGVCVMAPTLDQLSKDSCVMAKVLSVLNFSTALIPTALKTEKAIQNSTTLRDFDLMRASKFSDDERVAEAAKVLHRPLSEAQQKALLQVHEVGAGQSGKYNQPAGVGNYTESQLKKKADLLKQANFTPEERRELLERGIVGGPDYYNTLGVKSPALPATWPDNVQKDFEKALSTASQAKAPLRLGGSAKGNPVALEDVQAAVASQVGLKADNITPVISTEGGGKVVMTYSGAMGKKIMIKLNATNGQYYYTIVERMDGRDTYMMLSPGSSGRRYGGLRPCKDMALCHYNVGF